MAVHAFENQQPAYTEKCVISHLDSAMNSLVGLRLGSWTQWVRLLDAEGYRLTITA
ncbi:hypothetical protein [Actinoplanes sp. HUAS TT8]|uniref:hypothetical protein n=1 Tax=Actinoplanes sp. HUAS TT8 TaxID=3447453 RepID=UPI003F51B85C